VVELMSRMATGDASAAFELYEEFGAIIRRVLRGHLAELGAHNPSEEDLDGLTLDAVMALLNAAPSWKPDGGAMPWTWAERRLRSIARAHIGQWADELNDDHDGADGPAAVALDHDDMDNLVRAAVDHETIRLLLEAFEIACTERDAQILIAVKAQAAAGDPSPANTVAAERGMKPPAVRQAAKRTRDRVLHLAATDARFAPLADLPLLAP
jgi:hypothetical protein